MKYIHIILTNWPNDNIVPFNLFAVMMLLFAIFPRAQQFFTWNALRIDRSFARSCAHSLMYSSVCHEIRASSTIVIKLYYPVTMCLTHIFFSLPSFPFIIFYISFTLACLALRVIHFFGSCFCFRCCRSFFWSIA